MKCTRTAKRETYKVQSTHTYTLVFVIAMVVSHVRARAILFVDAHSIGWFRATTVSIIKRKFNSTSLSRARLQTRPTAHNILPSLVQMRGGDEKSFTSQPTWRRAYLAIGSNLGDRFQNISLALSNLQSSGSVRLLRTSFLRKTDPMYVLDQPEFLNGAVEVETTLSPSELLREIKRVERDLGRDLSGNSIRNGPRPVDLDILLFDAHEPNSNNAGVSDENSRSKLRNLNLVMKTDELEIPHPRMTEREFVLAPMNDLDSEIVHPVFNETLADLLLTLRRNRISNILSGGNQSEAIRVLPLPRGRMLSFGEVIIMGILNITPDSFSDGGRYNESAEAAVLRAKQLVKDGAHIIDIGGESTRPGAEEVDSDEELRRVLPVIKRIRQESDIPISIDTRHSVVAKAAIEAGADIVNDVSGGVHDTNMLRCVASLGVPMILMHMRGNPQTMQKLTNYGTNDNVVTVVSNGLMQRSVSAEKAGVHRWLQILDPGIGFAKNMKGNLQLLKGATTLRESCGRIPFLFGPSRKRFIGEITGEVNASERDSGTVGACLAVLPRDVNESCTILRVHNVKATKHAVMVFSAIQRAK